MQQSKMIRTEFAAAIAQIVNERNIPQEAIFDAIKSALVSAYRRQIGELEEGFHYYSILDETTGESKVMKAPALEVDEETGEATKWDETKAEDVTPAGFGRIAAQTAKQVILQKIRESEKSQILSEYEARLGEVVTGQILRMDGRTVVLDIGRGQGFMPPEEQMRGEFYRMNSRISVHLREIRDTFRGQRVIVSRATPELVKKLFEREVPEVAAGAVEIVDIAREAGVRTKLAVRSTQDGVDPVGSCVGQRGVRVQEVIRELNNEKIDIIPYSEDLVMYFQAAFAPAEGLKIDLDEKNKKAVIMVPDDQLSLAIGRGGQNARLAAKLTGWGFTVKSAAGDIETEVTGEEEYEIDTYEGLEDETRVYLIQNKLTTIADIERFQNKWRETEDISDEQKELLSQRLVIHLADRAAEDEARQKAAAEFAAKQDETIVEEAPVQAE